MTMTDRFGFAHGDHICALYETPHEQLAIAAGFLADGLRAGERVLYVASTEDALAAFRRALTAEGIDTDLMLARDALSQGTHAQAHLDGGFFDSERMLRMLNVELERALSDGFTGYRTCGDMSWLLEEAAGSDQVLEYEAMLNEFFHRTGACGMCQYDRHRLSASVLDHALATHAVATLDGRAVSNPFYLPPRDAIARHAEPGHLSVKLDLLRRLLS